MAKFLNPRPGSQPVKQVAPKSLNNQTVHAPAPAKTEQAQPASQPQNNAPAKDSTKTGDFFTAMKSMVDAFSIIDESVFKKNVSLAAGNGMTIDDRTVPFECAEFIMSNMAYIFMGLVLDERFKTAFIEAVSLELKLDNETEENRKALRKKMSDPNRYESKGNIVLGFTQFTPVIESALMDNMTATFNKLDKYAAEFDEAVTGLSYETKLELGMIFSNFMYLIRAFTHNDVFMSYVIAIVEEVKKKLS